MTGRHRETRVIPLFLRQILPASMLRTRMTLTGWCLVIVSLCLGVAAYNTTSNILFLTLSLLLSSLILSGILSLINFKKLNWDMRVPAHLRVGETGVADIFLVNNKSIFPSMSISFHLQSEIVAKEASVYLQNVLNPGKSCILKWSITPQKRGRFKLSLVGVQSQFPFGFLRKTILGDSHAEVIVWPARVGYAFQFFGEGYRISSGTAKKRAGQGSDLLNIRPYVRGDAPRSVHWKATARTGRLMIRQLAQEGESGFSLHVDTCAAGWNEAQFESLCSLVGSLAEDLFHSGRLERIQLGDSEPMRVQTAHDLHLFFDRLSSLKPQKNPVDCRLGHQSNQLTFGPVGEHDVAIYLEGTYAGQTDN